MVEIELKGIDGLVARLKALGSVRIPNYIARALNDTAAEAQKAMITETTSKLTTRGNWFKTGSRYGYNRQPANKNNLEARVFTRAPWMAAQETEVFKTAHKSFLTLPSPAVRPGGRLDPKKIPPRFYPSRMGTKLFKIQTKKGPVLAQRLKRAGLRIMYFLERTIHFPKRVHLVDVATKAVNLHAPTAFEKQVANAIREQGLK
jgi:hypothetical protein